MDIVLVLQAVMGKAVRATRNMSSHCVSLCWDLSYNFGLLVTTCVGSAAAVSHLGLCLNLCAHAGVSILLRMEALPLGVVLWPCNLQSKSLRVAP